MGGIFKDFKILVGHFKGLGITYFIYESFFQLDHVFDKHLCIIRTSICHVIFRKVVGEAHHKVNPQGTCLANLMVDDVLGSGWQP